MKVQTLFVLVALLAVARPGDDNVYVQQDGKKCAEEGSPNSSDPIKAVNRLKNRNAAPGDKDIDPLVSLMAMVAPGRDDTRFDATKGATVRGLVMEVKVGGKESCNCQATNPLDMDTHVSLALAPNAPKSQWVIVEVTPRLRKQMKDKGEDWSTKALETGDKKIKGKWVEITGWLMFDFVHTDGAENTSQNPGSADIWRATCWEIHPITSIKILDGPPAELKDFKPESFAALQAAHAKHLATDKAKKLNKAKNDKYLEKLTDEEKKEIEEEANEHRK
jgi:hypothetical protein